MKHKYTDADIQDVLITAIEGGINYWAAVREYRHNDGKDPKGCYAVIVDIEGEEDKQYRITPAIIRKGIKIIQSDDFQIANDILLQVITNNQDAISADCIVQAALFGELVYG